jgi:hypothetical protein
MNCAPTFRPIRFDVVVHYGMIRKVSDFRTIHLRGG